MGLHVLLQARRVDVDPFAGGASEMPARVMRQARILTIVERGLEIQHVPKHPAIVDPQLPHTAPPPKFVRRDLVENDSPVVIVLAEMLAIVRQRELQRTVRALHCNLDRVDTISTHDG